MTPETSVGPGWDEDTSKDFINFGDFFVPRRDEQFQVVCDLLPEDNPAPKLAELCCGAGGLSAALLAAHPGALIQAYDRSPAMLAEAELACKKFAARFQTHQFEIAADNWRQFEAPVEMIYSSLAVHHLDGPGKARLFTQMAANLNPGGRLVIVDLIEPASAAGCRIAARQWDAAVAETAAARKRPDALAYFQKSQWNYYADPAPDPIDQPSSLVAQLAWMAEAGLETIEVHWLYAGHAIFSGRKPN